MFIRQHFVYIACFLLAAVKTKNSRLVTRHCLLSKLNSYIKSYNAYNGLCFSRGFDKSIFI